MGPRGISNPLVDAIGRVWLQDVYRSWPGAFKPRLLGIGFARFVLAP